RIEEERRFLREVLVVAGDRDDGVVVLVARVAVAGAQGRPDTFHLPERDHRGAIVARDRRGIVRTAIIDHEDLVDYVPRAVAFHEVTRTSLVIVWSGAVVVLAGRVVAHLRAGRLRWARPRPDLSGDRLVIACVAMCGVVLLVTFVIAVVSPPNNWDSMVYHL